MLKDVSQCEVLCLHCDVPLDKCLWSLGLHLGCEVFNV